MKSIILVMLIVCCFCLSAKLSASAIGEYIFELENKVQSGKVKDAIIILSVFPDLNRDLTSNQKTRISHVLNTIKFYARSKKYNVYFPKIQKNVELKKFFSSELEAITSDFQDYD